MQITDGLNCPFSGEVSVFKHLKSRLSLLYALQGKEYAEMDPFIGARRLQ